MLPYDKLEKNLEGQSRGAFWGLLIGQVVGVIRMVLDFVYPMPPCGDPEQRPAIVASIHYTYFSVFIFFFTGICVVACSYMGKAQTEEELDGVTWWTRVDRKQITQQINAAEEENDNSGRQIFEVSTGSPNVDTNVGRCRRWVDVLCGIGTRNEVKDIDNEHKLAFL